MRNNILIQIYKFNKKIEENFERVQKKKIEREKILD